MNPDFSVQLFEQRDMSVDARIDRMLIRYGIMSEPDPLRIQCPCGWEIVAPSDVALEARREHPCFQRSKGRKGVLPSHRTDDVKKAEARVRGNEAARTAGRRGVRTPVYTRETAVASIRELASRLGRVPTWEEAMRTPGIPKYHALTRMYGTASYSKLLTDAGLQVGVAGRPSKAAA